MNIKSTYNSAFMFGWLVLSACSIGLPDKKNDSQGGGSAGSDGGTSASAKLSWEPEEFVDPYEKSGLPGLAQDADGNAWAVWNHLGNAVSDTGEIQARRYDVAKGAWEDAVVLDDTPRASYHVVVGGSERGDAIAVWTKAGEEIPDELTIRAARYSAEDGTWSDFEELGTIPRWTLAGIRADISSEGTAVVAWSKVFVDNVVDDADIITMSRVHAQVTTRWFDGDWHEPAIAFDMLDPESGVWAASETVIDRFPNENFDLTFEDERRLRALAGWNDGVYAMAAEDGQWSEPAAITDDPGGTVQIARLANGDILAAFAANGSLYSSTSDAGDSSFSEPQLMERTGDVLSYFRMAAAPASTPTTAAVTWIQLQSGAPAYATVRTEDGSWTEAKKISSFGTGYPRVAITTAGEVVVGSGDTSLWTTSSLDGTTWPSSYDQVPPEFHHYPVRDEVRFAVSPSGVAMFLWTDSGAHDPTLKNHVMAIVGR